MNENLKNFEEIRAIATMGLNYSKDPYDKMRYERLLEITANEYSKIYETQPKIVLDQFKKDLGYVTCKVGVNAAVFNEDGKILLEQRADDLSWGIPGGWVDVNETPEMAIKREIKEETALEIGVGEVIKIFSRSAGEFGQPHSSCHILYSGIIESGQLKKSFESMSLGFYHIDEIKLWHRDHRSWVEVAIRKLSLN